MIKIKNFSIFSGSEVIRDGQPSHSLSTKVGEDFIRIGVAWTKTGSKGSYLSSKLQDSWVDHTNPEKSKKGFVLVLEDELRELEEKLAMLEHQTDEIPKDTMTTPSADFPDGLDVENIPF